MLTHIANIQFEVDPQEEEEVWKRFWKEPDNGDYRLRLVEMYLPLVTRIVNKLSIRIRHKVEVDDLLGSGVLGLHDAISNYSKQRKTAFSTFAYKRVRGAILDSLRKQDHLTRTQRQCYRDICAAISVLTERFARPPTDQEISEETGIAEGDIAMYIGMGSNAVSLNDETRNEGVEYLDFLADDKAISPVDAADVSLSLEKMRRAFRKLPERDQQLLFLRHFEEMSVKEVAVVLDISEGRISQLYKQIILKLKALMESNI